MTGHNQPVTYDRIDGIQRYYVSHDGRWWSIAEGESDRWWVVDNEEGRVAEGVPSFATRDEACEAASKLQKDLFGGVDS